MWGLLRFQERAPLWFRALGDGQGALKKKSPIVKTLNPRLASCGQFRQTMQESVPCIGDARDAGLQRFVAA